LRGEKSGASSVAKGKIVYSPTVVLLTHILIFLTIVVVLPAHFVAGPKWSAMQISVSGLGISVLAIYSFMLEPVGIITAALFFFVYRASLFMLLSEILMRGLARRLTKRRVSKWSKEMEYLYLALGIIGILGSINKLDAVVGKFEKIDMIGPAVLMTAVVLRFIKTRGEIGEWNKLK